MHSRCRRCEPVPEELRRAAELLERRWLFSVMYASLAGALRFNEFRQAVQGISPKTLSDRLAELEEAGVLERRVIPATPPYAEYRLTARGRQLAPVVEAAARWVRPA
jgi:DNA-binding HxlR family transcriptional regulator